MANDDTIGIHGGLEPLQQPFGSVRMGLYKLTTSLTAVYRGQPMDLDSNGGVVPATVGDFAYCIGPVLGFVDSDKAGLPTNMTDLNQEAFLDGNKDSYVLIADDPNQLFTLQSDTGGSTLSISNVGNTATFLPRATSGSTVTGRALVELDRSTAAADTGGVFQILGLSEYMNSDGTAQGWDNYAKVLIRIANHRLNAGALPGYAI